MGTEKQKRYEDMQKKNSKMAGVRLTTFKNYTKCKWIKMFQSKGRDYQKGFFKKQALIICSIQGKYFRSKDTNRLSGKGRICHVNLREQRGSLTIRHKRL